MGSRGMSAIMRRLRQWSQVQRVQRAGLHVACGGPPRSAGLSRPATGAVPGRSEEHTSELQSHSDLVCRLLLEKKKKNKNDKIEREKRESCFVMHEA